ncbi:hypothetical protein SKAU_G00270970 [Synaphobranchus kaupii]|uniref:Uncharacterized protein n=1 Tax=Synaphobranchus kaupii TaxID=118154 RepID=A0A9Q1INK2_SYNKA|nr:hypothetical protein SKAU_G00270970 [Synaphobranchus kaupii]
MSAGDKLWSAALETLGHHAKIKEIPAKMMFIIMITETIDFCLDLPLSPLPVGILHNTGLALGKNLVQKERRAQVGTCSRCARPLWAGLLCGRGQVCRDD